MGPAESATSPSPKRSLVGRSSSTYYSAFLPGRLSPNPSSSSAAAADPGKPRPFLDGVFKTACNDCVSSKRGCSGGQPCDHCLKRGKTCVYAPRRKSGPRSRAASASQLSKSRAKPKALCDSRSAASPPPGTQPGNRSRSHAPWTGHGNGDRYIGSDDRAFVWERRTLAYPQQQHQQQQQRQPPVLGDRKSPLPSMADLRRMESSPPPPGHQLQTPSPPAPGPPIRSVSAAVDAAGGRWGFDGHGRGHGSIPLPRASSEDPASNNKRTRLSLTPPPRSPRVSAPGDQPLGSSTPPPPRSLPTAFHSSSTSSSSLGARGGLMSRWRSPPKPNASHTTHWVPAPLSVRASEQQVGGDGGGPGLVPPVAATPAPPISAWSDGREREIPVEATKAVAPPTAKGVLDRVPSFSGFGGGSGGGDSDAAEGPSAASSWAAIAAMAASCVDEGRDEDELEASFGSMFPTEKQEEARLQLKLKVQQLRLERKEQQLRQWQEQLEQQQQQQEERPSPKRQLSLGTLLMDEDGEVGGGSSKQEGRSSLALVTAAPAMPVRAVSTESCASGSIDGGATPPVAVPFAAYPSSALFAAGSIDESSGGGGGGLPPADDGDQTFSQKRSASEGSSSERLLPSGQLHPRQDLPRTVSLDHVVYRGDAAAAPGSYRSGMGERPAPVKREPSFLRDVTPSTLSASSSSSSSFSSTCGGDENTTGGSLGIAGDLREKLSREESLLRAIEVVNARSGGVDGDVDCEEAAAELIASVGLGDMTAVAVW